MRALVALFTLIPVALSAQTPAEPEEVRQTIRETVTVTADAPPLPSEERSTLRHVVDDRTIITLPLNGRQVMSLAVLSPGVALPPGSTLPRINGGRPRTNEYLFDGIAVLQPEPGQVPLFPIVDAIQSFTIETNNPSAEYGRFNGGVVNVVTKSGTDALHGTLFNFLRHEALNARNYFASAHTAKPRFRRSQAGGVIGGPIRRRHVFFFADYQSHRQTMGRTVISTVPTLPQRDGIFTSATIPREQFDPVAVSLLDRYPLPTTHGAANNYRRDANERMDQEQWDVRVDSTSPAGHAFVRVSSFTDRTLPVTPLPDGSGATSGTPGPQDTHARSIASNYSVRLSPSTSNELRLGFTNRSVLRRAARVNGAILPTYAIAGYQHLGSPAGTETDFQTSVLHVANTVSWSGAHYTIKAGLDLRWSRLDVLQAPSPAGHYQFSAVFAALTGVADSDAALASFLLGQVQTFSIDVQSQRTRNRARVQEYFVQDDWRATARVTVNAGLRYTLNFPSYEENDQSAVFNLENAQLEYLGRDGHPRTARRLHRNNFGPRLGIVARASERTAVRAGYGLVWIEQTGITTPFTTPSFPFLQTITRRALDNTTPAFLLATGPGAIAPSAPTPTAGFGQGVFAVDRELGSGYVQQWNMSVQRELWRGAALEVAYVGSKITRVGIPDTNLNQLTVEQLATGPALLERVPNPYVGIIPPSSTLGDATITRAQLMKPYPHYATVSLYRSNVGNTNYHGGTVKLEQRLTRGVSYSIAYTRSRLMDDASSVFDASVLTGPIANYPVADSFNRRLERDYSTGDIPHVLVAHAVWNVPRSGGLSLSAIATVQSGTPLPITQATNFNAFAGFGTQRPNRIGTPMLPSEQRTPDRWFDTRAFVIAPQFTLGTSSRNPVRGPGYRNVDLAIARRSRVAGDAARAVRAEEFNLLNSPVFAAPNTVVGSAAFGSITSAGDPRVVQVAVKLIF